MLKFLSIQQPEAINDQLWTLIGSPWSWLALWLLIINLFTFLTFGVDKWKAIRKEKKPEIRRIPEKSLFLCAFLGGSVGALLAMQVFHHKTLHKSFRFGIPAILTIETILLVGLTLWMHLK